MPQTAVPSPSVSADSSQYPLVQGHRVCHSHGHCSRGTHTQVPPSTSAGG